MLDLLLGRFQWYRQAKGGKWEKRKVTVTCLGGIIPVGCKMGEVIQTEKYQFPRTEGE